METKTTYHREMGKYHTRLAIDKQFLVDFQQNKSEDCDCSTPPGDATSSPDTQTLVKFSRLLSMNSYPSETVYNRFDCLADIFYDFPGVYYLLLLELSEQFPGYKSKSAPSAEAESVAKSSDMFEQSTNEGLVAQTSPSSSVEEKVELSDYSADSELEPEPFPLTQLDSEQALFDDDTGNDNEESANDDEFNDFEDSDPHDEFHDFEDSDSHDEFHDFEETSSAGRPSRSRTTAKTIRTKLNHQSLLFRLGNLAANKPKPRVDPKQALLSRRQFFTESLEGSDCDVDEV